MAEQKLQLQVPVQGWKQFLTARTDMLAMFDTAQEKTKSHKVKTSHGKAAEAEFRKWLSSFLPKRYGVTSGYVISTGVSDTDKTPHFDVIIYDQLETPILWTEGNPDNSSQGRSLAIPVENVLAIIEVKSRFSTITVKEALKHLSELDKVMSGIDEKSTRYKIYLPRAFRCGIVFFDLYQSDAFSKSGLNRIGENHSLRGFFGGIVLRGEGHTKPLTAQISQIRSETPVRSNNGKGKSSLLEFGLSDSIRITDSLHLGAMLTWGEANFSGFAFDLLAMLNGTYEVGRASSFYGLGTSEME